MLCHFTKLTLFFFQLSALSKRQKRVCRDINGHIIKLRLSPVRDTSEDQTAHAFPRSITSFSSLPRSSLWRHDAIPLPGVCCNASERRPTVRGWFGETDLQTGATTEKDAQHYREMVGNSVDVYARGEGKFSSHCARAWALTLTPKEQPPRLRIRAAPGFSVLVLGFQPRLLGNRTVTSRTDVTTDTTARATPDQSSTRG